MRLLHLKLYISMLILFSGCSSTGMKDTLVNETKINITNKYSYDDIRVDLKTTKIYNKSNNKLINGQIIDDDKNSINHLYFQITNGLLSRLDLVDARQNSLGTNFSLYDNKEMIYFYLKSKESLIEVKFRNQKVTYLDIATMQLELDENKVKNFYYKSLKNKELITINNNKVKYYKLPDNELIKSTEYHKDTLAINIVNALKNIINKKPFKHFTYKTQIALLYYESKSSISIEECQSLLGKKLYDKLFGLYQDKKAVLMQCETKAFESI